MAKTRHIQTRMNQRAIDKQLLQIATDFGSVQEHGGIEKYVLSRKSLDLTVRRLDQLRGKLMKARDKGGLVLVTSDNSEITTYRLDSYNRSGRH